MRNNLLVIGGGIIAFVIIKSLLPYGMADWVTYVLFLVIVFICYRVIQNNKKNENNPFSTFYNKTPTQNPFSEAFPQAPFKPRTTNYLKYIVAGIVVVIIITPRFWGAVSVYFFTVGDNLNLLYLWDPLIVWGILGLFAGIAYGGFVACKKYKLNYKYAVMPVLLLLTVLLLLLLNNRFLKSHTGLVQLPVIDSAEKRDSTLLVPVVKHKRRRHHKLVMPQKPDSSINSLNKNPSN